MDLLSTWIPWAIHLVSCAFGDPEDFILKFLFTSTLWGIHLDFCAHVDPLLYYLDSGLLCVHLNACQFKSAWQNWLPTRHVTQLLIWIKLQVTANDTGGLQDEAHVFIYLLREDQRVRFVLRAHPSEIREKIHIFRLQLARVANSVVNIDDLRVHENKDGSVDNTKTDLYLHLVNGEDHSVLEVDQVLRIVDKNIEQLDELFKVCVRIPVSNSGI